MKYRFLLPVAACAFAFMAPDASANHIDFFVDAPFASANSFGDVNEVTGDPGNILFGGTRGYEYVNNGDFTGVSSASLVNGGPLQLADAAGALGTYRFSYGAQLPFTTGTPTANFITGENYDRVQIVFDNVTGSGSLTAFIEDGTNDFTFNPLTISSAGVASFLYSDVQAAIPAFNLMSVTGFYFEVASQQADSTFTISSAVRAVPEPTSLLLVALAGSGLLLRRRR